MGLFGSGKKKKDAGNATNGGGDKAAEAASPEDGKLEVSPNDITDARKWFEQANKLTDDRNYDYAIECYLNGLKYWPEAVEDGHQRLRVAGYSRWEKGGKKPGTIEAMKHSMSGRDPLQAMLNAEWLWARDPINLSYMEGILKNAAKAKCERTVLFIGPIYFEAIKNVKKLSKDRFQLLRKVYEEIGNRCERRGDFQAAVEFFQGAITVLDALQSFAGQNREYGQDLTDLATKVTIIKGKYDAEGDFRKSMKDSESQRDIQDRERMVMDHDRLAELIEEARQEWQANPGVSAKLIKLADLLCKEEKKEHEDEAIKLLDDEYAKNQNYSFKMRADEIRIKQLRRIVRQAVTGGDKSAIQAARVNQLRFELRTYRERVEKYPTDNRLKYEYGKQLMRARQFDEAIPVLQEARNDPKNRILCLNLIGRCFYEKGYHSQAVSTYNQALEEYELEGDDLSKELYYWLGRTFEAYDKRPEAEKAYGQLIQWDYNYKDVRQRLEALEE